MFIPKHLRKIFQSLFEYLELVIQKWGFTNYQKKFSPLCISYKQLSIELIRNLLDFAPLIGILEARRVPDIFDQLSRIWISLEIAKPIISQPIGDSTSLRHRIIIGDEALRNRSEHSEWI